jgi:nitronate monooxygenase
MMWPTAAAQLLGLEVPVIQAPMGGGPSTVELAAATSNAGGMGSLAGGYLGPARLREDIRRLRSLTSRPFAVNLFVPSAVDVTDDELDTALRVLEPYRLELGLPPRADVSAWSEDFDAQLDVVIDERVPGFSFAFGLLSAAQQSRVRQSGAVTIGTATNVAEARALEHSGVDIICAQGAEAGGHHGSWLAAADDSLIGSLALVPLICDAVRVPVVAAGGIMDGRGVAAVLCLGAGAAQMGTAFMLCSEAGTAAPHRAAIRAASETDVVTTSTVTGRLARGVRNRLMTELRDAKVPPYPVMNALTAELRRASAASNDDQLMSLWCGQAAPLAAAGSADDLVRSIAAALASTALPSPRRGAE